MRDEEMATEPTKTEPPANEFQLQLSGYRPFTICITYHKPDFPRLVEDFILQKYDLAPGFPNTTRFIEFWMREIEGRISRIQVFGPRGIVFPTWRKGLFEGRVDGNLPEHCQDISEKPKIIFP